MRACMSLALIASISSFGLAAAADIDPASGAINIGTVNADEVSLLQQSTNISSSAMYVRGSYVPFDFGYLIESLTLGKQDKANGFTAIEEPIFQVTVVDLERVLNEIDPDGKFADGCELIDDVDRQYRFKNANNWCDPEFRLKKVMAFDKAEKLTDSDPLVTRTGIFRGDFESTEHMKEVEFSGTAAIGSYQGFVSDSNYFVFDQVRFVTTDQPVSIKEIDTIAFQTSEDEKLIYRSTEEYLSYSGFPRKAETSRKRFVEFNMALVELDNGDFSVTLVPDFWDGNLPLCSTLQVSGVLCNAGYEGSVNITSDIESIERIVSF